MSMRAESLITTMRIIKCNSLTINLLKFPHFKILVEQIKATRWFDALEVYQQNSLRNNVVIEHLTVCYDGWPLEG